MLIESILDDFFIRFLFGLATIREAQLSRWRLRRRQGGRGAGSNTTLITSIAGYNDANQEAGDERCQHAAHAIAVRLVASACGRVPAVCKDLSVPSPRSVRGTTL